MRGGEVEGQEGIMIDLRRGRKGAFLVGGGGKETRRVFVKEREMKTVHIPSVSPPPASGFT